ncbi:MAG: peptide chain release factor 1 [Rhodobacteraceae bacterium]|nr:peptide chain release factor 1 [Paracoccaceae bacterium]
MLDQQKMDQIRHRCSEIEARMAMKEHVAEIAALSREYNRLMPIVDRINQLERIRSDIESVREMLGSPELREMAQEEIAVLAGRQSACEDALTDLLLADDPDNQRSVVLEIRAGTGGEEAALFSSDLYAMYERYCALRTWKFRPLDASETALGGFREVVVIVEGQGAYHRLKYESGVHRVQRVPETESGGRIHTSAATVAVLPQAEDVDVRIRPEDIRVETMRASGAGGQHVNTTDSAVRITHIPTGITVLSSEKSQHRNRAQAMTVLRSRLYRQKAEEAASERAADRKMQVGSGDRSERVRTYNFPQGRLTDHRINLTLYKLEQVLQGNLDEIIDALIADERMRALART